jgi:hypothetical protein
LDFVFGWTRSVYAASMAWRVCKWSAPPTNPPLDVQSGGHATEALASTPDKTAFDEIF